MTQEIQIPRSKTLAVATRDGILVPRVIASAGDKAARRFLEVFAATIRNKNARMAYHRACVRFCAGRHSERRGPVRRSWPARPVDRQKDAARTARPIVNEARAPPSPCPTRANLAPFPWVGFH